jgi:rhamnogalacturonan endolyase
MFKANVYLNYSPELFISLPLKFFLFLTILVIVIDGSFLHAQEILLEDNFNQLNPGLFSSGVVGAHAEYHYIPQTAPQGNWVVSCFRSNGSQRAWRVLREKNQSAMYQSYTSTKNETDYTHPMVIAGDELWQNYSIFARFIPESKSAQSGIMFRYHNDRCYYFFGVNGDKVILKLVNHGETYRTSREQILAESKFNWKPGEVLIAKVTLLEDKIRAEFENGPIITATDKTFPAGKIGLMSDIPTRYLQIKVTTSKNDFNKFLTAKKKREAEWQRLQADNPKMVLWKKFSTDGFGVGRNLRFGDLNNDGQMDVLLGQVIHHGPKDRNSELSCLTATTFDGEILWQIGEPDLWKDNLTNDVGFQIHDINQDGKNEVIYCMNTEIVVADAATGKTLYKSITPENKSDPPHDLFPRVLGDCLFFCDIRGLGYDRDILIKDRYQYFWILNDKLEILWEGNCKTGHYPYAEDIDSDGKDEIAIGYSLYDQDGDIIFCLDDQIQDHADGVAIVNFDPNKGNGYTIMNAASDEGMLFYDLSGKMLRHHHLGHVQNPSVANFRDDLPGLEIVSINFWGNQGIIHFFDSKGELYYDFEPVQHGSMMLPINWTGKSEEFFVLSASVIEGGLFDGWGRKVVDFPADGHPELCNAVLDITGDCRDEIVVWDAGEVWVYTQDNNPIDGKLYKPRRNPLYNYSNYQATVSSPGW